MPFVYGSYYKKKKKQQQQNLWPEKYKEIQELNFMAAKK